MATNSDDYLSRVDDTEETRVLMLNWAEYLIHTAGEDGALQALMYYENIGWISDEVLQQMTEYISDMAGDPDQSNDPPRPDGEILERLEDTPFELHAGSLQYIADISGDRINADVLNILSAEDRIENRRKDE